MTDTKKSEIFSLLGGRRATRADAARAEADRIEAAHAAALQAAAHAVELRHEEAPVAPVAPVVSLLLDDGDDTTSRPNLSARLDVIASAILQTEHSPVASEKSVVPSGDTSAVVATPSSSVPERHSAGLAAQGACCDREIRATFIIKEAYSDAMRDLAWYDRKKIKDVLNEALEAYMTKNRDKLESIGKMKQG
ncbi:MAG: hypothetical protein RR014_00700 [Bilophila sp.]